MKTLIATILVGLMLTSCSVATYVKDIQIEPDTKQVFVERCELTVYLAFYGLIAKPTNCSKQPL